MLADYHVHSEFSDDSIYQMEDVVNDAIHKNWTKYALQIMWIMELK